MHLPFRLSISLPGIVESKVIAFEKPRLQAMAQQVDQTTIGRIFGLIPCYTLLRICEHPKTSHTSPVLCCVLHEALSQLPAACQCAVLTANLNSTYLCHGVLWYTMVVFERTWCSTQLSSSYPSIIIGRTGWLAPRRWWCWSRRA